MKIANSETEAIKLVLNAFEEIGIKGATIDEGSYKGGLYDCYYILHPSTGIELFAIAY